MAKRHENYTYNYNNKFKFGLYIHHTDPDSIRMNGGPVLTKEGKVMIVSSQEDYRMLADGTWVDSHGQVVGKQRDSELLCVNISNKIVF